MLWVSCVKGLNKHNLPVSSSTDISTRDYLPQIESRLSRLSFTLHSVSFLFFFFLPAHQEEFLSLCVDKLTEILTSDFLNVPKEEMVFEAAMLWLNKCPSRKQSFEKVRFT